jgi:hypothetical protein
MLDFFRMTVHMQEKYAATVFLRSELIWLGWLSLINDCFFLSEPFESRQQPSLNLRHISSQSFSVPKYWFLIFLVVLERSHLAGLDLLGLIGF